MVESWKISSALSKWEEIFMGKRPIKERFTKEKKTDIKITRECNIKIRYGRKITLLGSRLKQRKRIK